MNQTGFRNLEPEKKTGFRPLKGTEPAKNGKTVKNRENRVQTEPLVEPT